MLLKALAIISALICITGLYFGESISNVLLITAMLVLVPLVKYGIPVLIVGIIIKYVFFSRNNGL